MEELRKKIKELSDYITRIRQTEYICQRGRSMFEIAETDSKIYELEELMKKIYIEKKY